MSVVEPLDLGGGEVVELVVRALGVEPLDPLGGGELDLVDVAPGRCRWISSVLNDPTVVSAIALSNASPTEPTEGSMPSSIRRLVSATEGYCPESRHRCG